MLAALAASILGGTAMMVLLTLIGRMNRDHSDNYPKRKHRRRDIYYRYRRPKPKKIRNKEQPDEALIQAYFEVCEKYHDNPEEAFRDWWMEHFDSWRHELNPYYKRLNENMFPHITAETGNAFDLTSEDVDEIKKLSVEEIWKQHSSLIAKTLEKRLCAR